METEHALVKVTIVGYYPVSSDELDNYKIEEFDPVKMAKIDEEEYRKHRDIVDIIEFFGEDGPTSVTFEAVDMNVPEC